MGIRTVAFLESCDTPVSGATKVAGQLLAFLRVPRLLARFDESGGRGRPYRPPPISLLIEGEVAMNLRAPRSVGLCQRSRRLKGCNVKAREHIISSWQDSEHDCSAHSIQAYVRASRSHDCCVDETLSAASKAAGAWIVSPWHACPECSFCCCDIPLLVQTSFSLLT